MTFETERLLLRPWTEDDAEDLFEYAKNPNVGPVAGWPVHTSVEESKGIIKNVLSANGTYAVCLKENNKAIGCIGLHPASKAHTELADNDMELGFWIGEPYWGKGLMPEAVKKILEHAFEELTVSAIWCGYYDGNQKSKRCQEKCGFIYHHTEENKNCPLIGEVRTEHFNKMTREDWLKIKA